MTTIRTPIRKLIAAMNGEVATAVGRGILFVAPFVFTVTIYAGKSLLAEQVSAAPAVAATAVTVADHGSRIRSLEEYQRTSSASNMEIKNAIVAQTNALNSLTREFDRLAGAVEAANRTNTK